MSGNKHALKIYINSIFLWWKTLMVVVGLGVGWGWNAILCYARLRRPKTSFARSSLISWIIGVTDLLPYFRFPLYNSKLAKLRISIFDKFKKAGMQYWYLNRERRIQCIWCCDAGLKKTYDGEQRYGYSSWNDAGVL